MTIMIVGVGALGTRIAQQLIKQDLVLVDYDIVQETNLTRQPFFTLDDVGKRKVDVAKTRLGAIRVLPVPFTKDTPVANIDCIVEGTDNMHTRSVINDVAKKNNIPVVFATAATSSGMVTDTCWQCLTRGKTATDDCSTGIDEETADAVVATAVGMVNAIIEGAPKNSLIHIRGTNTSEITVTKNPECKTCKNIFFDEPFTVQFCPGTKNLQARPSEPVHVDLGSLENTTESYDNAKRVTVEQGTALVHKHGLIEFENVPEDKAQEYATKILGTKPV